MLECIASLGEAIIFSTLDDSAGYWQVEIYPKERDNTALPPIMDSINQNSIFINRYSRTVPVNKDAVMIKQRTWFLQKSHRCDLIGYQMVICARVLGRHSGVLEHTGGTIDRPSLRIDAVVRAWCHS